MSLRPNQKHSRKKAKAATRSAAAARGSEKRRRNVAEAKAPETVAYAKPDAVVAALRAGFRQAHLRSIRSDLADMRHQFLQGGDAASARRMTRLLAEFDFLSKRLPAGSIA